jgi:hypothetical protein
VTIRPKDPKIMYPQYVLTFASGAVFGGIVLALLLRRAVRNELTGKAARPRKPT